MKTLCDKQYNRILLSLKNKKIINKKIRILKQIFNIQKNIKITLKQKRN